MRTKLPRFLACVALTLTVAAAGNAQADPDPARGSAAWAGDWTNMNKTVHIRASRCGDSMCGTVIWATDQAKADVAAKGGRLIGTQVFRDFRPTGSNEWRGKVYIPDMGRSFSGTITLTDNDSITATGCAFFGVGCQTRHYKRIR